MYASLRTGSMKHKLGSALSASCFACAVWFLIAVFVPFCARYVNLTFTMHSGTTTLIKAIIAFRA